jgi:hypothetical protein
VHTRARRLAVAARAGRILQVGHLERFNAALRAALKDPDVTRRMADLGAEVVSDAKQSPEGLQTWLKAPMFPELEMDWLVEVTSERYYGPTTLGAVQEFLRLGEIGEDTFIINSCDGSRRQIKELTALIQLPSRPDSELASEPEEAPPATTMAINLRDRISDLEQSLFEERRALQECEARYRELEAQFSLLQTKQQQ